MHRPRLRRISRVAWWYNVPRNVLSKFFRLPYGGKWCLRHFAYQTSSITNAKFCSLNINCNSYLQLHVPFEDLKMSDKQQIHTKNSFDRCCMTHPIVHSRSWTLLVIVYWVPSTMIDTLFPEGQENFPTRTRIKPSVSRLAMQSDAESKLWLERAQLDSKDSLLGKCCSTLKIKHYIWFHNVFSGCFGEAATVSLAAQNGPTWHPTDFSTSFRGAGFLREKCSIRSMPPKGFLHLWSYHRHTWNPASRESRLRA